MFHKPICLPAIVLLLLLNACASTRKAIYFENKNLPDSTSTVLDVQQPSEAVIQPDDIIAINLASTSFYKEGNTSQVFLDGGLAYGGAGAASSGKNTYLVDSTGNIDYPRIGKVKLSGLSTREAKDLLALRLKDYLFQPAIEVRIINYRITILGEIGTQGPLYAPNHKLTIIDAVAAAGGIPITGRKDNVLIIREEGAKRVFAHVDLNSRNVFNSPYYHLKQNDIVYVEPSRIRRQEANEFLRFYLPTFSVLLSTAVSLYAIAALANK